jgi:hypothetical protein
MMADGIGKMNRMLAVNAFDVDAILGKISVLRSCCLEIKSVFRSVNSRHTPHVLADYLLEVKCERTRPRRSPMY